MGGSYIEHHRTGFPHVFTIRNLVHWVLQPPGAPWQVRLTDVHGKLLATGRHTKAFPAAGWHGANLSATHRFAEKKTPGDRRGQQFTWHLCSYWLTLADISSVMNIPTISNSFCTTNTQSLTWFQFLPPRAQWPEVKIVGPKIKVILVKIF